MTSDDHSLRIGLEVALEEQRDKLANLRFGILANRASVDRDLNFSWTRLGERFPGQLAAIFTPQHGLWGDVQANMVESPDGWHPQLEVPIYSLYSHTRRPTEQMLAGLECLVVDLQDVGTRVYTYAWTLVECLRACGEAGVSVLLLDRPNPVGGCVVEGPLLEPDFLSFVGGASIPMRHGLTLGELGHYLNTELALGADFDVVPMSQWSAEKIGENFEREWIPPSPNLPTIQSTLCYPGFVLLEGINLSEGRGTTTPFEIIGAPFIDPERLLSEIASQDHPGVRFLPLFFRPTFDKWSGELCGGLSIHVTDPAAFRPYRTAVQLLIAISQLWPSEFDWLDPPYEYEREKPPIDIIAGSSKLREIIPQGANCDLAERESLWEVDIDRWNDRVAKHLLYPRPAGFTA